MPLVDAGALVRHARENHYAVAQVNTNGAAYDITRAIIEVAVEERAPIILGAYEGNLAYRGFPYAGMLLRWFAKRADVPVAFYLSGGLDSSLIQQCDAHRGTAQCGAGPL